MDKTYENIILGGGPAGTAAGVYAGRKKIKTALITDGFGGQSATTAKIENIPGVPLISGSDLAKRMKDHLEMSNIDIVLNKIVEVKKEGEMFKVKTESEGDFFSKTILITLGRKYRDLEVPGEEEFKGKGIAYCSTCDAPFFKDKDVAVIGGGNTAFNSALDLSPYAKKIYILIRSENIKADPVTVAKVKEDPKVEIIFNAQTKEIFGGVLVEGLNYIDLKTKEEKKLVVDGIFVNIGMIPKTGPVKDLVKLNDLNQIEVLSATGRTSTDGVWAAGDITTMPFRQIITAAGDGTRAILDINNYLKGLNID